MILASSPLPPPDPGQLAAWLSCLCAVLGIVVLFRKAFGKEAVPPQPFKVQGEVRYATHEELIKVEKRVEALQQEVRSSSERLTSTLTENYNALMTASAKGRSGLHKEIADVAAVVHRMEEAVSILRSLIIDARKNNS